MPTHTHVYVAAVILVLILSLLGIILRLVSIRNKKKRHKAAQRVIERPPGIGDSIGSRYRGSPSTHTRISDGMIADRRGFVSQSTSSRMQAQTTMPTPLHEMPSNPSQRSVYHTPGPNINRSFSARSPHRTGHTSPSAQATNLSSLQDGATERGLSSHPNHLSLVERMREVQLLIIEIQCLEGQTNAEGNRDEIQALQRRITELSDTDSPADDSYSNAAAYPIPNVISEPPPAYQHAP